MGHFWLGILFVMTLRKDQNGRLNDLKQPAAGLMSKQKEAAVGWGRGWIKYAK